jgi:hypothetical protein
VTLTGMLRRIGQEARSIAGSIARKAQPSAAARGAESASASPAPAR